MMKNYNNNLTSAIVGPTPMKKKGISVVSLYSIVTCIEKEHYKVERFCYFICSTDMEYYHITGLPLWGNF